MTAKPPAPQAISSLLRRSGFARSVQASTGRRSYEHTAGYHVRKDLSGGVSVNWWPESNGMGPQPDGDLRERDSMLAGSKTSGTS